MNSYGLAVVLSIYNLSEIEEYIKGIYIERGRNYVPINDSEMRGMALDIEDKLINATIKHIPHKHLGEFIQMVEKHEGVSVVGAYIRKNLPDFKGVFDCAREEFKKAQVIAWRKKKLDFGALLNQLNRQKEPKVNFSVFKSMEFVEGIIEDAGIDGLPREEKEVLSEDLSQQLANLLFTDVAVRCLASDKEVLEAYTSLLEVGGTNHRTMVFLREHVPNINAIFAEAAMEFKRQFIANMNLSETRSSRLQQPQPESIDMEVREFLEDMLVEAGLGSSPPSVKERLIQVLTTALEEAVDMVDEEDVPKEIMRFRERYLAQVKSR